MAIPYITNLPVPPTLTNPASFPSRADLFMTSLDGFSESCNTAIDEMNNVNDNIDAKYTIASVGGTYKGAWSSVATYSINDVVSYSGSYYRNQTGVNTATAPDSDTLNWADANAGYTKAQEDALLAKKSSSNLLINSAGLINQRGYVSGTATVSANQYTLDRWRVVTSGQSLVFTISENITTFTAPSGGCEQVVEGLSIMTGTYTLSWEGTATAAVNGISVLNGGQVVLTGGTNATVRFTDGTFKKPKFEYGETATEWRTQSYQDEFIKCLRYAFRAVKGSDNITGIIGIGFATSSTSAYIYVSYPTEMYSAPTLEISSVSDFVVNSASTINNCSSLSIAAPNRNGCILVVGNTGMTMGYGCLLRANNTNSKLLFSAEI